MTAVIQESRVLDIHTTTVMNASSNFRLLMDKALVSDEIVNIVSENGNVVMISENAFRDLLLTVEVNGNPRFKASLLQGLSAPLSNFVGEEELVW